MNISFLKLVVSCSLKQIIKAASEGDREGVLKQSIEMKFLTGYETKVGKYHPDILCSGLHTRQSCVYTTSSPRPGHGERPRGCGDDPGRGFCLCGAL